MFDLFRECALLAPWLTESLTIETNADRKAGGNPYQIFSSRDARDVVGDGFNGAGRGLCTVDVGKVAELAVGGIEEILQPRCHCVDFRGGRLWHKDALGRRLGSR